MCRYRVQWEKRWDFFSNLWLRDAGHYNFQQERTCAHTARWPAMKLPLRLSGALHYTLSHTYFVWCCWSIIIIIRSCSSPQSCEYTLWLFYYQWALVRQKIIKKSFSFIHGVQNRVCACIILKVTRLSLYGVAMANNTVELDWWFEWRIHFCSVIKCKLSNEHVFSYKIKRAWDFKFQPLLPW